MRLTLSSIGELCYILGNIASKEVSLKGENHLNVCLDRYRKALLRFQNANANDEHSTVSIAKTYYKLGTVFMQLQDFMSARYVRDPP